MGSGSKGTGLSRQVLQDDGAHSLSVRWVGPGGLWG